MADRPVVDSQSAQTASASTPGGRDSSAPPSAERVNSTASFVPSRLGPYLILDRLGKGGMGVVYRARHSLLDRVDAVKVMSQAILTGEQARKRFLREVRLVAALDHPHIVRAHGADESDGCVYLAMELVAGKNLKQVVDQRGPLEWREACVYLNQAAQGLQHAHEKGMVHRDLKPGNLMLSDRGVVKILDFGLATSRAEWQEHLTDGGGFGTFAFMAPEQRLDARSVDIRADIYSLGATLYFLLAARTHKQAAATLGEAIEVLRASRPDLPPSLLGLLQGMMEEERSRRPTAPRDVADALSSLTSPSHVSHIAAAAAASSSPASGDDEPARSRRNRFLWGACAAALIVAGLAAWFGYWRDMDASPIDKNGKASKRTTVEVVERKPEKGKVTQTPPSKLADSSSKPKDSSPKDSPSKPKVVAAPTFGRGPAVDVVFVLDVTVSMGNQIKGLEDGIEPFLAGLQRKKMEPRVGLVTFRDLTFDSPGEALQLHKFGDAYFSTEAKELSQEVGKLKPHGGGDEPESSLDALGQAAEKLPWDDKATRVLVLITDALPQTKGNSLQWKHVLPLLSSRKIDQIHLLIREPHRAEYEKLRQAARGKFFDLKGEGSSASKFAKLLPIVGGEIAALARRLEPPYLPEEPGKAARVFRGHSGPITCLAAAREGRFVSGGEDGTVRLWDIGSVDEGALFDLALPTKASPRAILDVAFTPDGRHVLIAPGEPTKPGHWNHLAWKITSPELERIELPGGSPTCYACDKMGKWIAVGRSAGLSGFISNVLRTPGPAAIYYLQDGPLYCSKIAMSDDGALLLTTSGKTGLAQLWSEGKVKHTFDQATAFPAVLSGPGRTALILDEKDSTRVRLLDIAGAEARLLLQLKGHSARATCCAMSASGREAITGAADGTVRLWSLENGAQLAALAGHEDEVTCLGIFPDGDYAVSGSRDGTIRLWNLAMARK